ncbi:hypothetical protein D3C71_1827380 [compost metagenome]
MATSTNTGTGRKNQKFGRLNQRAKIAGCVIGVQMLTISMAATVARVIGDVARMMLACNAPSVLRISQVAPSKA